MAFAATFRLVRCEWLLPPDAWPSGLGGRQCPQLEVWNDQIVQGNSETNTDPHHSRLLAYDLRGYLGSSERRCRSDLCVRILAMFSVQTRVARTVSDAECGNNLERRPSYRWKTA